MLNIPDVAINYIYAKTSVDKLLMCANSEFRVSHMFSLSIGESDDRF